MELMLQAKLSPRKRVDVTQASEGKGERLNMGSGKNRSAHAWRCGLRCLERSDCMVVQRSELFCQSIGRSGEVWKVRSS